MNTGRSLQVMDAACWLKHIVGLHFDPIDGAPFWLEQRDVLGFDPVSEVGAVSDLAHFPPFPREALASRPVTDFVPRRFHDQLDDFVVCETGGTTGLPARTVFRRDEFDAAFVAPFVAAVEATGFPHGGQWLFIGPSGPHPIGKAARLCAAALGAMDPFSVDFDPRWARKLEPASLGRTRYTAHVLAQAEAILASQQITVLFATPPVLAALGARLPEATRLAITGIHLGGMAGDAEFWRRLTTAWFPNAIALSGYGNSLAGMCPQVRLDPARPPEYFPHGVRLHVEVSGGGDGRGMVRFHRLDESCFLPMMEERDEAEAVLPPENLAVHGFVLPGLRDPRPPAARGELAEGLY
jgi:hypothetical protein